MAESDWGSAPMASRRSKVSLRERPASINRRVRSVATRAQLPELDDARTEILKMGGPPKPLEPETGERCKGEVRWLAATNELHLRWRCARSDAVVCHTTPAFS